MKTFSKEMLKEGMVVELNTSDRYLVLGGMLLHENGGGHQLYNYDNELNYNYAIRVEKVFKPNRPLSMNVIFKDLNLDLIWDRDKDYELNAMKERGE